MGEKRAKKQTEEEILAEAEKTIAEVKEKVELTDKEEKDSSKVKKIKAGKRARSIKYIEAVSKVDKNKFYPLEEALELVRATSYSKFDGSIEAHIKIKIKKGQDNLRGTINLAHGVGKVTKVAIVDEAMIEKILKDKKTEFDVLLARPEMMPKLAKVAKILGPAGKMPNPKTGTITTDPEKAIEEFKAGKMEYRADSYNIIHQVIGKVSFDTSKLMDNYKTLFAVLPQTRVQSITLCSTMGPGIKVKL